MQIAPVAGSLNIYFHRMSRLGCAAALQLWHLYYALQVTRELVQLAPTDAQKAQLFRDAANILASHKAADYPRRSTAPPPPLPVYDCAISCDGCT